MKDELVEQALYAYRQASGRPHEDAAGYNQHLAGIEAALAIARPAILEEAAKAIQCDCCDVCGESPDYEYVCANELAARVRSLIPAEERE